VCDLGNLERDGLDGNDENVTEGGILCSLNHPLMSIKLKWKGLLH